MPVQSCEFALISAVQEVLERMCFVSLAAETEISSGPDGDALPLLSALQGELEQALGKQVAFSGPLCGNVTFWFSRRLAFALAANLLGSEIAEMEENDVSDALGEIANMACGSMLGSLEAKQAFALQTPIDAGNPAPGASSTCLFHTEEGLLLASQSFREVGR